MLLRALHIFSLYITLLLGGSWSEQSFAATVETKLTSEVLSGLPPISTLQQLQLYQNDPAILDVGNYPVLVATPETALSIIGTMADEGWGPMDFFAHPFFRSDSRVIYYPPETLALIHDRFRFESIFFLKGATRDNQPFSIQGILVGRGRIVILYPFHIHTHRSDPLFGFLTGNYEFFRVNIVDITTDPDGPFELSNFRGRDTPSEEFRPVRAPLNVPIQRIQLADNRRTLRVYFGPTWLTFPHPLVERRN